MLAGKFVVETGAMMCDAILRILERVELFWGEEEEEEEGEADEEEEESPGIFSVGAFVRRGNESEARGEGRVCLGVVIIMASNSGTI